MDINEQNAPTRKKKSKGTIIGASLMAGAALFAGVGAFAAFTDTESATRSVDAGQLDITLAPTTDAISDMAPGDIWSTPMTINLPDANNDGNLIEFIELYANPNGSEVYGQAMDNGAPDPAFPHQGSLLSGFATGPNTGEAGLRLVIQNCVGGTWVETPANSGLFDCAGGPVTDVLGTAGATEITGPSSITGAARLSDLDNSGTTSLGAGAFGVTPNPGTGTIPDGSSLNLLLTFAFPGDNPFGSAVPADNSFENASLAGLTIDATAVQRDGIER